MHMLRRIFGLCRRKKPERFPESVVMSTASVDAESSIGAYTFVGDWATITKATVGRYCSIAPRVMIGLGEHDTTGVSMSGFLNPKCDYAGLTAADCTIGNDVWIGADSIVRRGVSVGDGAVVGANSFVNRDVPAFAVVAGSPARIVKYRFSDEKRRRVLASEYWKRPPEEARRIIEELERTGE